MRRPLVWAGAMVAVAAAVGLGLYFARVGLDDADKLASVIGVFLALAGLGTSVYGLVTDRQGGSGRGDQPSETASPGGGGTNIQMTAEASGQGRVYQAGHDQNIDER